MTANLIFWLLAGIDDHGKNFSIFLRPGGGFRLTPLYDVIAAFPLYARKQLDQRRLKMAALPMGQNRHDDWNAMLYHHWLTTTKACRFPADGMGEIVAEVLERLDQVISEASSQRPDSFPDVVAGPIFTGMGKTGETLGRSAPPA